MAGRPVSVVKRLKAKTVIDSVTGCWLWQGYRHRQGYGQIRYNGKVVEVHRVSAQLSLGYDLNSKFIICHKPICINKNCWNPAHLYIGTQADNIHDIYRSKQAVKNVS